MEPGRVTAVDFDRLVAGALTKLPDAGRRAGTALTVTAAWLLSILLAACAPSPTGAADGVATTVAMDSAGTVRLLFAGDVMLGRDLAPIAAAAGDSLFTDVRFVVSSADLAAANLESPLTRLPHASENPNALEADPATAALLRDAGFDLMAVANNHTGDAGPAGVVDTLTALETVSIVPIGGGVDAAAAAAAVVREVRGIRIGFLAFDASGSGLAATAEAAGVNPYRRDAAANAVTALERTVDVVVVSLHGVIGYRAAADPLLTVAATDLVAAGADVVWGHGAHVVQPVEVVATPRGGVAVIATGLGNFLFDQSPTATQTGMVLEVMVSSAGVVSYREGLADHADRRVHFTAWNLPGKTAALVGGEWWSVVAEPAAATGRAVTVDEFSMGDVISAGRGDVTGDGAADLVVSYRRPYVENPVNRMFPAGDLVDPAGRSAHVGVFDPATLEPLWAAGTLLDPIAGLAVCDGAIALAFDTLGDRAIVATGGWTWSGFGFATARNLPGPGTPGCADVDGDGRRDAMILHREAPEGSAP